MSRSSSTPRAQSLVMPEDQRSTTSADAATQRALLAEQRRTNELLAKQVKRGGFSWVRVICLLILCFILFGGLLMVLSAIGSALSRG